MQHAYLSLLLTPGTLVLQKGARAKLVFHTSQYGALLWRAPPSTSKSGADIVLAPDALESVSFAVVERLEDWRVLGVEPVCPGPSRKLGLHMQFRGSCCRRLHCRKPPSSQPLALSSLLPALSSQLPALSSLLPALSSPAPSSQLSAPRLSSLLPAPSPQLPAQLSAPSS